jgi:hypothetical protein
VTSGGSLKLTIRDKKIARALVQTRAFLFNLSQSGLAESSLTAIYGRDVRLAEIQIFLLRIATAADVPEAIRQEASTKAETASRLAGRPPIYEVPPAVRRKALELAFALDAATKRGTGSSTLTPGDQGRLFSLMRRKIEAGESLHKAAESVAARLPRLGLTPRRLEQIYRRIEAEFKREGITTTLS